MEKVIDYKTAKSSSLILSREEVLSHIRENWQDGQKVNWLAGKRIDVPDKVQILEFSFSQERKARVRIYDGVILWITLYDNGNVTYSSWTHLRVEKPPSIPAYYNDLFWD